jgi:hypothetical protein
MKYIFFNFVILRNYGNNRIKKISSSLFLYSERCIASTETKNTPEGSSDTQLFGAGKSGGVALSGGLHAHLPQKDIEKKSKFDGGKSGRKKKLF